MVTRVVVGHPLSLASQINDALVVQSSCVYWTVIIENKLS